MDISKYKKTSIGLIPGDWEIKKLEEIGVFSKGKGILKAQVLDSGLPCIRYGEIYTTHNFIIKEFKSYISEEVAGESQEISKGDILFAGSGETIDEIGKAVVYLGNEKAYAGGDTIIFKPEKDNSETISYILETDSSKKQKRTFGQGNSVVHIYPSDLKKLKIPVPPLPEQQKIASILSTWDVAIDNCKAVIEELKVRNKGLVNKLIIDNGELNVKLGNVFVESKIPTVDADVNKRITVRLTLKGIEKRGVRGSELEEATSYYLRKSGQFIYGKQNLHKGAFGIIPDELDGFESSSDIPAFDINKEFNSKYIFYYFSRRHFYEKLEDISTGTGSKRIQPKELYKVEIKVPSTLEKQNAIVKIIDTATDELTKYQQKLQTLQLQKKGLMQQLLTGKVRVKT